MLRWLIALVLLVLLACGGIYVVAGRGAPPRITIEKPDRFVGQAGSLELTADAPNARFTALTITLEQNGKALPLFTLDGPQTATVTRVGGNQIHVSRPLGKQSVPELQSGTARLVVTARRPSLLNLRTLSTTATKDFQVRLEPPRLAVLSTKHYVNHGGSEMVVYRATPAEITSGVRVGDLEYPGFPASGAGMAGADPAIKVAFFALLHDQPIGAPIEAFARDEAGNEAKASFVDNVFPKPFKKSRIEIDDKFMNRVVPDILDHSPELKMIAPAQDSPEMLAASWLGIYGNCVILDHGMGVQSLYGHLMSFDVKVGDKVSRGQTIGRSDSTGLAGGDHLHFTMLVGGRMVTPVEWWDPHWIADRVERKLKER